MEQRYDIEFAGETLPGFEETAVRRAIAALFKADERTLDRLFSGERLRIKRDCDDATAQRFEEALRRAGAKVYRVEANAASAPTDSAKVADETVQDEELWSLAPVGSLIPSIPRPTGTAPDTSNLSIAPLGATLGTPSEQTPAARAPDWTIAPLEPGSTAARDNGKPNTQGLD